MQPGKREMRLRLHASGGQNRHAPRPRSACGGRQESRLADARVAPEHERLATRGDLVQQ
jgi:hypothetical protein